MTVAAPADVNVRDYLDIIRRRKAVFVQVFVIVMAMGGVITALSKPVYQTQAKLLVPTGSSQVNVIDASNPIATMLSAAQPDSVATQIQVLQGTPFISDAIKEANIPAKRGGIKPFVKVESVEGTNIIQITVEAGDPQDAANLANSMLDLHLKRTDLLQTTGLEDTRKFVRAEQEKARKRLDDVQAQLLRFRKDHRVLQLTVQQDAQAKEYVDLESRVREGESNVKSLTAQVADLRQRLQKEPVDLVEQNVRENPRYVKLQEKLDDLKLQRDQLALEYTDKSKRVRDVDDQVAMLTTRATAEPKEITVRSHTPNMARPPLQAKLTELEAELQGQEAKYNNVRSQYDSRKNILDNVGPWEIEQTRLNHERDSAQSAYTMLSDRLRDLDIRARARLSTARQIERAAVPVSPIRPKRSTDLALAAVLGLILGAAMAFLQEYLDDRVNSPDDVERFSLMPALGHVPLIASDDPHLLPALPAHSPVGEAYRAVRSSISFAGVDTPLRSLLITSASKGEGKTQTSVNIASAMAMDGKRVILVDADLRRPSVHRVLNMPNESGTSEVLAGLKTVDEAIQDTAIQNLRLIPAGPVPPNPAELLGSTAFDRLMADLDERADVVIFDSPPCMPVTDPLIMAGRMDGVILVVYVGQTKKGAIKHVEGLLRRAHARILGIVYNRAQASKSGYYYYHYSYYYGSGYYAENSSGRQKNKKTRDAVDCNRDTQYLNAPQPKNER